MQEDMALGPRAARRLEGAGRPHLEGNVVVGDLEVVRRRRLAAARPAGTAAALAAPPAFSAAAPQDEARVGPAHPHAHGLLRVAVLVLVLVGTDGALDVHLPPLADVVTHDLGG